MRVKKAKVTCFFEGSQIAHVCQSVAGSQRLQQQSETAIDDAVGAPERGGAELSACALYCALHASEGALC